LAIDPNSPLSKRLAGDGLLPMFGFPTRIRYLYHQEPKEYPIRRGVVERNLDIAVSQFAPGAQTVKDDALHTAIGVAYYRPKLVKGQIRLVADGDPLGPAIPVGICRKCQAIDPAATQGACPVCHTPESDDGYRIAQLSEPAGFISYWTAKADYSGAFEYSPQALRARVGAPQRAPKSRRNFVVDDLPQTLVHQVNDNAGKDFTFLRYKRTYDNIWFTMDAVKAAMETLSHQDRQTASPPFVDRDAGEKRRALASIATTDVVTVGLREIPPYFDINPKTAVGRALWYSFGFLARRAMATRLDVPEGELQVGMQPYEDHGRTLARIFLSDTLENGAGYSSMFGDPSEMEVLLVFLTNPHDSFLQPLLKPGHQDGCDTSCHHCLRDFANMTYHPLLDWRIGLDVARLALDSAAPVTLSESYWKDLADRTAAAFFPNHELNRLSLAGLPAGIRPPGSPAADANIAYVLAHPLWSLKQSSYGPELANAEVEAGTLGKVLKPISLFYALRQPFALPT
jgi:hypothetical protein